MKNLKYKVTKEDSILLGRNLSWKQAEELRNKLQKRFSIKLRISVDQETQEIFDRMDGLVPMTAMTQLMRSTEEIIRDLIQEGFEISEIIEYVCTRIKEKGE